VFWRDNLRLAASFPETLDPEITKAGGLIIGEVIQEKSVCYIRSTEKCWASLSRAGIVVTVLGTRQCRFASR